VATPVADIGADLAAQHAELAGLLSGLDEAGWQRPSRCEGWTVADVVTHLAQTDEMALASAEGRFAEGLVELARGLDPASSVDEGADLMVARDRGQPPSAIFERWQTGAAALRKAFEACDPSDRVTWVAGELSVRTLTTTRLAETWIHTGDVACGLGVALDPPDRLRHIARLAWRTLPYAFARSGRQLSGPVAFELVGPSGDEWSFRSDESPLTTIRGTGFDLCLVAGRRADPADTGLKGEGPDTDSVLELVRTFA
jgi:uncharacterized protein (TIGR03084 family)